MPAQRIGEWELAHDGTRKTRGGGRPRRYQSVEYEHAKLPITAMASGRSDGSWEAIAMTDNGRSEWTVGDGVYRSRESAVRALVSWMERHPHPARLVTSDREFGRQNAERSGGGLGGAFDSLF